MRKSTLGGRYQLEEQIGSGGMATVYRAVDALLERTVAVKVLNPQYATDQDFVRRFRREARSAASLTHPNIVGIYDVGQEDDTHYIVMEYVEGETLKDRIERTGALGVRETVRILEMVGEALAAAHRKQVVHRDIKPHNILITENGTAKVSDFGIARATSKATLTYSGGFLGSVHYFSPEQAKGEFTDEKSDIYSLGVVAYEMLTGRVPFQSETPIGVALKHIQHRIPSPREVVLTIPRQLERIVLKATERDPQRRYQSADEFLADLREFARTHFAKPKSGENQQPAARNGDEDTDPPHGKTRQPNRRRIAVAVGGLVLLLVILGVRGVVLWLNPPIVEVPDLVGKSLVQAEQELRRLGLKAHVVANTTHEEIPATYVVSQDPEAGVRVKATGERRIDLVISSGPAYVVGGVPDIIGRSLIEAEIILKGVDLEINVIEEYSATVPKDYVIDQNPKWKSPIKRKSVVDVTVSLGPRPTEVVLPSFIGERIENVGARLAELGLSVGSVVTTDSLEPANTILAQQPEAGTAVPVGSTVDFRVSTGFITENETSVNLVVPGEPGTRHLIRLKVTDKYGERVVYEEHHLAGENVVAKVAWGGATAVVRWYVDGKLTSERRLP
ncbi:MAG: Stk1 family PASTA domain-containing Ser/Thr kinase [Bacillota bacterium]